MINLTKNPGDLLGGTWSSTTVDVNSPLGVKFYINGRVGAPKSLGYHFKSKSHKKAFGLSKALFIPTDCRDKQECSKVITIQPACLLGHKMVYDVMKNKPEFWQYLDKVIRTMAYDFGAYRYEVYQG